MEVRVFGPVELCVDGRVWEVGPPQQRHTLAALAVDAGRPVLMETLIDRVWDEAPAGARRVVQVHITRIRRLFERVGVGDGPPARVVRRSGGYLLEIDTDRIDLHRFRRLVESARTLADGDAGVSNLLREARSLWRGEPLAGLGGRWAAQTRQAWTQQYLNVTVAWAQAETLAGRSDAVIDPLGDLVDEHPFVESLAAVFLRALCVAGRPAEALEHYTKLRRRLVDELGTAPSAELQAMYRAILRGELDVSRPTGDTTSPVTPAPAPAQLPADVRDFIGRGEHLARLDALLAASPGRASTAAVIAAVSGTAGVGKTALAVHWAHTVRERFPDGQLYVNLRGFDPAGRVMAPAEAVRGFLDALGVPPANMPLTPDAQAALYRSLIAGKRMLVVLDNARDAEQVRPLLPGSPTAVVVVTSRNQLTGLLATDGARPLTLDILSTVEARDLFTRRLCRQRMAAEPDTVQEIITACARLPLALTIAAARALQNGFPLTTLAAELREGRQRLDALDAGDAASQVRAVFSWSTTALTPPAGRLFRLLGLHPGPDISTAAAASLAGLPVDRIRRPMTELARASLLTEYLPGRYTLHDLLRAYAIDLAHAVDPDTARRDATVRLLDHYTRTAQAADELLNPTRDPIALPLTPPVSGTAAEDLVDQRQAMAWLTVEYQVLLAAVRQAAGAGFDTQTWQLAWALDTFLHRQGHWDDHLAIWHAALAAAERLQDPAAQAYARRRLGHTETQLGRYADAKVQLEHALDLCVRIGDRVAQARTHYSLGYLWERQGHPRRALAHARQALVLHRAAGNQGGRANALSAVGWCLAQLGDHGQALTACRQALALHQRHGHHRGQAAAWLSLGYANHHAGRYAEAVDCYRRSITRYRDLGDRYSEAEVHVHLGDTHDAAGDGTAARAAWTEAFDIFIALDHPNARPVRAKLDGLRATAC